MPILPRFPNPAGHLPPPERGARGRMAAKKMAAKRAKAPSKSGKANSGQKPLVGIIMGSQSDWPTMKHAADALDALGVPYEARIVSAHRTPERMVDYAKTAKARGLKVIVAGAGGAAHLPGMTASLTPLPVFGVPVQSKALSGQDSLLSIVQMPGGIPVGTLAIGEAGAKNAGLLAAAVLALSDTALAKRLDAYRAKQTGSVGHTPQDR
jgi:5-(carboxyamino)imidazole ribonucleotide mutase